MKRQGEEWIQQILKAREYSIPEVSSQENELDHLVGNEKMNSITNGLIESITHGMTEERLDLSQSGEGSMDSDSDSEDNDLPWNRRDILTIEDSDRRQTVYGNRYDSHLVFDDWEQFGRYYERHPDEQKYVWDVDEWVNHPQLTVRLIKAMQNGFIFNTVYLIPAPAPNTVF